jgi:O-acetylserine/cysteine efflux transporter
VAALWGVNFVVIRVGLGDFPPLLLAALRFVVAALPVFFLPRPPLPWIKLTAVGLALFVGQFGFLFSGMANGMPAGLASVTLQSQAFFTVVIATLIYGERPNRRQWGGIGVALAGLAVIGATAGTDGFTLQGLVLVIAAALSWAIGNVLLRSCPKMEMLPAMVWLSLVPPLPLFGLSLLIEGPHAITLALMSVSWAGIGSIAYLAVVATLIGFGIWGQLIKQYPVSTVAPFSLLVPIFGTLAAALLLGERFSAQRLCGMVLVVAGLAGLALPSHWFSILRDTADMDGNP